MLLAHGGKMMLGIGCGGKRNVHVNHESSYRCIERQTLQTLFNEFCMMIGGKQLLNLLAFLCNAVEFSTQNSSVAVESCFEGRGLMRSVSIDSFSIPGRAA